MRFDLEKPRVFRVETAEEGGQRRTGFRLGYHDDTTIYVMVCELIDSYYESLQSLPGFNMPHRIPKTFRYGIVKQSLSSGKDVSVIDMRHETVRELIPKSQRSKVLKQVSRATYRLLKTTNPSSVDRFTKDRHLEAAALRKYEKVTDILTCLGYRTSVIEVDGQQQWTADKYLNGRFAQSWHQRALNHIRRLQYL